MDLDPRYRIVPFSEADEIDEDAIIAFWEREGAVTGQEARQRVGEAVLVALEEGGGVVGLSTAFNGVHPQLRINMWNYRTYVAREHRLSSIAYFLLIRTRDYLEERFVSGVETSAQGLIFELENEGLKKHNEAVWPYDSWFTFIGENARGAHLRVYYFQGARVAVPG